MRPAAGPCLSCEPCASMSPAWGGRSAFATVSAQPSTSGRSVGQLPGLHHRIGGRNLRHSQRCQSPLQANRASRLQPRRLRCCQKRPLAIAWRNAASVTSPMHRQRTRKSSPFRPQAIHFAAGASTVLEPEVLTEIVETYESELVHTPNAAGDLPEFRNCTNALERVKDITARLGDLTEAMMALNNANAKVDADFLTADDQQKLEAAREQQRAEKEARKAKRAAKRAEKQQAATGTPDARQMGKDLLFANATSSSAASTKAAPATVIASSRRPRILRGTEAKQGRSTTKTKAVALPVEEATDSRAGRLAASRTTRRQTWSGKVLETPEAIEESWMAPGILACLEEVERLDKATKLLTGDQEKLLGYHVQDMVSLRNMSLDLAQKLERSPSNREVCTAAKCSLREFDKRLAMGKRCHQVMVDLNHRLVLSVARKYEEHGLEFNDLVAEGTYGLARAVEKFDPKRGYKLSTYAHWWIRQAITRAITDQGRALRTPVHIYDRAAKAQKIERQLAEELKRQPTIDEISERSGISVPKLNIMRLEYRKIISTDREVVGKEGGVMQTVGDMVEDTMEAPIDFSVREDVISELMDVLTSLTDREAGVLKMRYGLEDGQEHTLEEIGKRYQVTRERIRQIEHKAMHKLRQPSRRSRMQLCLEGITSGTGQRLHRPTEESPELDYGS